MKLIILFFFKSVVGVFMFFFGLFAVLYWLTIAILLSKLIRVAKFSFFKNDELDRRVWQNPPDYRVHTVYPGCCPHCLSPNINPIFYNVCGHQMGYFD